MTVVKPLISKGGLIRQIAPTDELSVPFIAVSSMSLGDELSPPILAANTNNYNPTGIGSAVILNLSSSANIDITGITQPSPNRTQMLFIVNSGTNDIKLKDQSASSVASARFKINGDITLKANDGITLFYSVAASVWRSVGVNT